MTRITLIITTLAGVAGGAIAGYLLAHRGPSGIESPPASAPAAADSPRAGERKVLYWHDPMVPGAKFDKPGKSPFMGMDLVPVYADADDAGPAVRVTSNVSQNLGIRIGTVERDRVQPRLHAVGSVAFDESLLELVQAERQPVGHEVHGVAAACELLAQLGRHRTRAADGRIAGDADVHR